MSGPPPVATDPLPTRRQPSSALCFVCGINNPHGLRLEFFDDGRQVWTEFTAAEHHQSWPGVLHGGVASAVLDETMGRVAFLYDQWVQTAVLELRFVKPAPLGQRLRATGELKRDARRLIEMHARLVTVDGAELLAEATGLFVRVPDGTRDEMVQRLGGDFEKWEDWLHKNRTLTVRTR